MYREILQCGDDYSNPFEPSPAVISLRNEVDFWQRIENDGATPAEQQQARLFVQLLQPVTKECKMLELAAAESSRHQLNGNDNPNNKRFHGSGLTDLLDMLDSSIFDALDEVWRCLDAAAGAGFPEVRMRNLIEGIAFWAIRIIKGHLATSTQSDSEDISNRRISVLWSDSIHKVSTCKVRKTIQVSPQLLILLSDIFLFFYTYFIFHQVKPGLQLAIEACDQWQSRSDTLIDTWTRYTPHLWQGVRPNLAYLDQFKHRLVEVCYYACW